MGKELLPLKNDFGWKSNFFKKVLDNYIAKADARRSRKSVWILGLKRQDRVLLMRLLN